MIGGSGPRVSAGERPTRRLGLLGLCRPLGRQGNREHDGEDPQQPDHVPEVPDPESRALEAPRGERREPDPREPRPIDAERDGREREVVEPNDRGEHKGRGDREREAAVAPGRRRSAPPTGQHRRARRRLRGPACTSIPNTVYAVLVECRARAEERPEVGVDARCTAARAGARRNDGTCHEDVARAAGRREPDGERPHEELHARREADAGPGAPCCPPRAPRERERAARPGSGGRRASRPRPRARGERRRRPASRGAHEPERGARHARPSSAITTSAAPGGRRVNGATR